MDRDQKIEEALSVVWDEGEKKSLGEENVKNKIFEKIKEDILGKLVEDGYLGLKNGTVELTKKGEVIARDITRRQRLAERLLIDVLEVDRKAMDSSACELEHILSKEVEESICTLLGHPKECPHGLPIPSGECCLKAKDLLESIVVPLSKFIPGEAGKIVYLLTHEHPQLHKLMSFGIVPGAVISIHQIFPSFVIQIDQTQVALEEDIASQIYLKRLKSDRIK